MKKDLCSLLLSNCSQWKRRPPLCHPERTRISCHAAPDTVACAPFSRERRMKFANATKSYRKSGAVEGSAVPRTSPGNVFDQVHLKLRTVEGTCCIYRELTTGRIGDAADRPGPEPAVWVRRASWVARPSCPGRGWRAA